jgi:hypothetical protein
MMMLLFLACGAPTHLQYDFGRSYMQSTQIQSNVSRSAAINEVYPLTGSEAQGIRTEVVEATTTGSKEQVDVLTTGK